ncbi:MAG: hypothetical protein II842_03200 [Butyrivibrio sp.]|nr:hypothetical protein [Butyrivibrio sp.]
MKKKVLVILLLIALLVGVFMAALISQKNRKKTHVNTSRRDGQVVDVTVSGDEDLEAVSGDLSVIEDMNNASEHNLQNEKEREEADSALYESLESAEATKPTTAKVDSVTILLLPEAVSISKGDAEAFYDNADFADVTPVDMSSFSSEDMPSKYDSRSVNGKCYVTKPEDQGYSYLCWSFAAIGALESDILKNNPDISYDELNLSEKHLSYYNMHKSEGSYGGLIDEDYRELVNADNEEGAWIFDYDTGYMAMGGVSDFCISLLTSWKGPVSEEGDNAYVGLYGEKYMFKENSQKPSDAYDAEYHVQDVVQIPSAIENRKMIKQLIMQHGAVTAGVRAENKYFSGHKSNLYSFYGGEIEIADHEVILVGWDDDYPATNFKTRPPGDGAFLCRNSWGDGIGNEGFFYLSYFDQTFGINNVAAYNVVSSDDENFYDNNYQTAGFLTYVTSALNDSENYVTAYSEATNPYGMLYTAISDENLRAIGLMELDCYQQYEIEVYVNPTHDDETIKLSDLKKPAVSMKVSSISGGFHTYALEQELPLAAGDEFFILVTPKTPGRLVFESAANNISKPNYDEWNNLTGNIHNNYSASGRSYYISEDGKELISQNDKDFFIKGYTNNIR